MELEELKRQVKIKMLNLQLGYPVAERSLEKMIEELIEKDESAYDSICELVLIEGDNIRKNLTTLTIE